MALPDCESQGKADPALLISLVKFQASLEFGEFLILVVFQQTLPEPCLQRSAHALELLLIFLNSTAGKHGGYIIAKILSAKTLHSWDRAILQFSNGEEMVDTHTAAYSLRAPAQIYCPLTQMVSTHLALVEGHTSTAATFLSWVMML